VFGLCVWIPGLDPPRGLVQLTSGLTSPWGPFPSSLGLTRFSRPVSIIVGTYSLLEAHLNDSIIVGTYSFAGPIRMTLRIFPIFLDKNGKICPSMQCQTNFSSFLKIEKFCPSVGQRRLRQSSGVLSSLSLCRATMARRESVYFFSKFFQNSFEKFCPSVPRGSPA
jgi:hypothetical protein